MRSTLRLLQASAQVGKAIPNFWAKKSLGLPPRQSIGLAPRPSIHQHCNRPEINSPDSRILTRNAETGELVVTIRTTTTTTKTRAVSDLWLRDRCKCSECINPDTLQRKTDITKIPLDVHVVEARRMSETDELAVTWSDGHESTYGRDLFRELFYVRHTLGPFPVTSTWGRGGPEDRPHVTYDNVMNTEEGLRCMTDLLAKNGLVFVTDTPFATPAPTQHLLERIAFIRHTHYGGFYDFTADLAMADTAYTNLALGAHTDTTYFSDPAGLQAFHILSHTADDGSPGGGDLGGHSLLVDGFGAAQALRAADPQAFKVLTRVALPWHASGNEGIAIAPDRMYPVLEWDGGLANGVRKVRWNNDDRGGLPGNLTREQQEAWFEAARAWVGLLNEREYWVRLEPGTVLIFDNWRVLHGRSAFTGKRRVCGGYISRDDWVSRWRMLNLGPKEARRQTMGY
ncbi:trimethyllysine dioxygenase [Podospora conica]|nr:trimethyllysine dioxygenase [Schizothecium conicum]